MTQGKENSTGLKRLREDLFLGLISLAPVGITFWILVSVIRFLDEKIYFILPEDFPRIPGLGIVAALILLLVIGIMARTLAGKYLGAWTDFLFSRLPVVRGLYAIVKQMSNALFSQNATAAFKRVVLVPFPSAESRSIGFVAGSHSADETIVFVPTAPNPTSGYVLIYKNEQLIDSEMPVHEALQVVVSCGAVSKKA